MIVLTNNALHKRRTGADARLLLVAANIHLVDLPAYCPELSAIAPVWHDGNHQQGPTRSVERLVARKHAVDEALARTTHPLRQHHAARPLLHRLAI